MKELKEDHFIVKEKKLIKLGASHAIIIPKKWLKNHNINLDEPLKMVADDILYINPGQKKGDKEK